jgi:2-polyprenyl-6-methoxyphenol hydroxylase-like FAD-dependent oxidoreductase
MYTEVNQQVARFAMRNDRTMFLFTFVEKGPASPPAVDIQSQKAVLRRRWSRSGWECSQILDALDAANELYFDRVSQIRMDGERGLWTRGRVTLIGDAASCVSLLAGQGSALAMIAAYILAGELASSPRDYAAAFARYEDLFSPFVRAKQKAALRFAGIFAPKSTISMFLRNQIMKLLTIPLVADVFVTRDLRDDIELPNYPANHGPDHHV